MPKDLEGFLRQDELECPQEVLHIKEKIRSEYEITALATQLERQKRFPILVLHQVTRNGVVSPFPVVTFVFSSRRRLARLLGSSPEQAGVAYYQGLQRRLQPVVVPPQQAPVKEVVQVGAAINLEEFPAPLHHDMDPGHYISAGFFTCYDPDTGVVNAALHRGWLKGRDEIRVFLAPSTHNALILSKYERQGRDMPAAYWIGHHPLALLGCEARIPMTESHFAVAGGLLGEPLRLVPSETLGEDFLIPADAEIVIEGVVPCGQRRPEGPFGEYTRYSGPQKWGPFMRVTAVTHRRGAHWQDIMVGHTHWMSGLVREGVAFESIRRVVPTVRNVYAPMSGAGCFHLYIQIDKTIEGLGKQALLAAFTSHSLIKHAFVFDQDVDIFDEKEVLLALATRFQGDKDLVVIRDCVGPELDPSVAGNIGTKVGFDCTKPVYPETFSERLKVPNEVMERLDLDSYISPERLREVPVEPYG